MTTPEPTTTTTEVEHLFRREAGRMSAVVVRLLGFGHLDLAEDIVHDALVQALEVWKFRGVPANPAAWLMAAAKNRAIDVIRRERTERRFAPEVADLLSTEWSLVPTVASAFEDKEIVDAELRLMFELCDGRLPEETQVMVILKYLCGFGVHELAQAFLSGEDAVEKRLVRARTTLQAAGGLVELGDAQRVRVRMPAVCRALYLMFSEGYHGSNPEVVVREELCAEALRLASLLAAHPVTGVAGEVKGLLALMCLLAARLPARRDARGDLIPLDEQDRSRWDAGAERARAGGAGRVGRGRAERDVPRGRDRRAPRRGVVGGVDRLAGDRRALRSSGGAAAESGGGAQPRGGHWLRAWAGGRSRRDRRHREPGAARRLPLLGGDARRSSATGGTPRRGAAALSARARAGAQRSGASLLRPSPRGMWRRPWLSAGAWRWPRCWRRRS